MQYTGIGKVRIFSSDIRRGINLIEDYVYKAIEKGCEPIVINAIIRKHGREMLAPTIVGQDQITMLFNEAYQSVKDGYGFFASVEDEEKFKEWLHVEIHRRVRVQIDYIGIATMEEKFECAALIAKRNKTFDAYIARTEKNPAQQRHEDIQNMRIMCKRCWDEKLTIGQLCREFKLSEDKINKFRNSVQYLREVRAIIINSRSKKECIKWLRSYKDRSHIFASRMGIKEDIAKHLLLDVLAELTGEDNSVPATNCGRRGQKGLAPTVDLKKKAPVCSLCDTEYYFDDRTGHFTHP